MKHAACLFYLHVLASASVSAQVLRGHSNSESQTHLNLDETFDFPSSPRDARSTGLAVDRSTSDTTVWMYHHGFDATPGTIREYSREGEVLGSWVPPGDRDGSALSAAFQSVHLDLVEGGLKLGRDREISGKSLLFFNGNYNQEPKLLSVFALDVDASSQKANRQPVKGMVRVSGLDDWVVGGTYHSERGSLFLVTAHTDQLIEVDSISAKILARHNLRDNFGYTHGAVGDISYDKYTGHLLLVSSMQSNSVFEVTVEGNLVREIKLPHKPGSSVSTGGLDVDECGGIWVSDSYHPNRVRRWMDESLIKARC